MRTIVVWVGRFHSFYQKRRLCFGKFDRIDQLTRKVDSGNKRPDLAPCFTNYSKLYTQWFGGVVVFKEKIYDLGVVFGSFSRTLRDDFVSIIGAEPIHCFKPISVDSNTPPGSQEAYNYSNMTKSEQIQLEPFLLGVDCVAFIELVEILSKTHLPWTLATLNSRSNDTPHFRGLYKARQEWSQRISDSQPGRVDPYRCRGANLFGCVVAVMPALNFSYINQTHFPARRTSGKMFLFLTEKRLETMFHVRELAARNRIMMLINGIRASAGKWLIFIWLPDLGSYIVLAHIARSKGSSCTLTILITLWYWQRK